MADGDEETPKSRISWMLALMLAVGTVYVPFLVMAAYVLAFVSCSHCKQVCLKFLPIMPGTFITSVFPELFQGKPYSEHVAYGIAATASFALIVLLALLARGHRIAAILSLTIVHFGAIAYAFAFLALIRA